MGLLKSAMVVAALAFAAPVWAHGGHGHDRDRDHRGWRGNDHAPAWGHHRHHHRNWDRTPRQHYYNQYYYAPPPVYSYAAPAPGIYITTPNIYIPLR